MKADCRSSIFLSGGGEPAHAVPISTGRGANLWVGSLVVTAESAEQFEELARVATDAATIQRALETKPRCGSCAPIPRARRTLSGACSLPVGHDGNHEWDLS